MDGCKLYPLLAGWYVLIKAKKIEQYFMEPGEVFRRIYIVQQAVQGPEITEGNPQGQGK
jgi:hypothetical protein